VFAYLNFYIMFLFIRNCMFMCVYLKSYNVCLLIINCRCMCVSGFDNVYLFVYVCLLIWNYRMCICLFEILHVCVWVVLTLCVYLTLKLSMYVCVSSLSNVYWWMFVYWFEIVYKIVMYVFVVLICNLDDFYCVNLNIKVNLVVLNCNV